MRIYFISEEPAALKLDGQYVGTIDLFERFAETDGGRGALCEIVPHGNGQPINFFADESFFLRPHDFADVYSACGEKYIHIDGYNDKNGLSVAAQSFTGGMLITIFRAGAIYAACDCGGSNVYRLERNFKKCSIKEVECCNYLFAALEGQNRLALFYGGRLVFESPADSYQCGRELEVAFSPQSCTAIEVKNSYSFDGEKFILTGHSAVGRHRPEAGTEHIAFFESVLYGGDSAAYLCDELKDRTDALNKYLGKFERVLPPSREAEKKYGARSAALLRRVDGRLFRADYFIAEIRDGKIENIFPAEE